MARKMTDEEKFLAQERRDIAAKLDKASKHISLFPMAYYKKNLSADELQKLNVILASLGTQLRRKKGKD
jgi:hypothetical protein